LSRLGAASRPPSSLQAPSAWAAHPPRLLVRGGHLMTTHSTTRRSTAAPAAGRATLAIPHPATAEDTESRR
ncbi:MAG: hypothetical protein J0H73_00155, partial [Salana multivorans]|nr:hypothetical protein [Salana multivorans]